jgi:hypothetical protein
VRIDDNVGGRALLTLDFKSGPATWKNSENLPSTAFTTAQCDPLRSASRLS